MNVVVAGRLYMSTRLRADQRKISEINAVGLYERPQGPDIVAIKHQVDVCTMSATNGVCPKFESTFFISNSAPARPMVYVNLGSLQPSWCSNSLVPVLSPFRTVCSLRVCAHLPPISTEIQTACCSRCQPALDSQQRRIRFLTVDINALWLMMVSSTTGMQSAAARQSRAPSCRTKKHAHNHAQSQPTFVIRT